MLFECDPSDSSTVLDDSGCSLSSSEEVVKEGNINILQENSKLKIEVERLLQSEKYYKLQYKKYKLSKLDILEKYYSSERNVNDSLKLLKDENHKLKEELLRRNKHCSCDNESTRTFHQELSTRTSLEFRKMQQTIDELQSVNHILRKQIDQLLKDSEQLYTNNDTRTLSLLREAIGQGMVIQFF